MKSTRINTKRITLLAALTALALITYLIESLFPPMFMPGAKMGLSNIFSLLALITLGPADAVILVIIRTLIGSIFGNFSSIIYSITAGMISILFEILLLYAFYPRISLISISVAGAVIHNLAQNIIFVLLSNSLLMLSYLPYFAVIGIASGLIVGVTTQFIIIKVPITIFNRLLPSRNNQEAPVESN